VQDAILVLVKTTIFLSVFCFVFWFFILSCLGLAGFCAIKLLVFDHKDREIDVFRYKTP